MTDEDKRTLHPATAAELEESLSFALRYTGKKRVLGIVLLTSVLSF